MKCSDAAVTCSRDVIDISALQCNCGVVWMDLQIDQRLLGSIFCSSLTLWACMLTMWSNSYSISRPLDKVTSKWPDSDSVVMVDACWQHSDWAANDSIVTVLPAVNKNYYTVTVQSPCLKSRYKRNPDTIFATELLLPEVFSPMHKKSETPSNSTPPVPTACCNPDSYNWPRSPILGGNCCLPGVVSCLVVTTGMLVITPK